VGYMGLDNRAMWGMGDFGMAGWVSPDGRFEWTRHRGGGADEGTPVWSFRSPRPQHTEG
jgi:hypothetical protein